MTMNINMICWNCRGTSGWDKMNRIKTMKKEFKLDIIALVETRADDLRIRRLCAKFSKQWNWASIAAEGYSGGIIILWLRKIGKISPVAHSRRALHLILSLPCGNHCFISVIYNAQNITLQNSLWKELSQVANLNVPWVMLGDFNGITSIDKHHGSSYNYYAHKANLFSNFIAGNSLNEVAHSGADFSWCNGRSGQAR